MERTPEIASAMSALWFQPPSAITLFASIFGSVLGPMFGIMISDYSTPLRLQLGRDAVDAVRSHAERLLADIAAWEGVAVATKVDPAAV